MNCHVYHLKLASQKGATITRFDSKVVKSLGLIFFQKMKCLERPAIVPSGNAAFFLQNFV